MCKMYSKNAPSKIEGSMGIMSGFLDCGKF